jgi:hypothetical protein
MGEPFRQSLQQWVPECRIICDKECAAAHSLSMLSSLLSAANHHTCPDRSIGAFCATFAAQQWQLNQEYAERRLDFNQPLQALREAHAGDTQAATIRLALLERSPWRKLIDWWRHEARLLPRSLSRQCQTPA